MATISYVEYPIYSIATDGEIVATSGGGGGSDYGIEDQLETHRVNLETGQLLPVISTAEAGGVVDSLCFNKNVDLWCGCCQGQVVLIQKDKDHGLGVVARFGPPPVSSGKRPRLITARFSPSGEIVVAGGEDKVVRVWRIARTGASSERGNVPPAAKEGWEATLVCELRGHEGDIKDCCVSSDSSLVASCGADSKLCLWDWRTGALLHSIEKRNPRKAEEKLTFRCGRFLPTPPGVPANSGQRLIAVACGLRGPSYFVGWSIAFGGSAPSQLPAPTYDKKSEDSAPSEGSNKASQSLPPSASSVTVTQLCESMCDDSVPCCQAEISTDGQLIAVGFADGKCKVYNRGLSLVAQSSKHDLPVTGLCFLNNNKTLVSTSADYSVVTLDLTRRSRGICGRCCCCRKRACFCGFLIFLFLLLVGGFAVHHIASLGYLHFISQHDAAQMGLYRQTMEDLVIQQRLHDLEIEQKEERRRSGGEARLGRERSAPPRQTDRKAHKQDQARRGGAYRHKTSATVKDEL
ncbi:WD domain, G-beta repeat-containing protein [Toxoplasma gondii TgCatPRC2]|uniref:WD domain, G-beta repeat-containing protein n=12 Tax=Toxoplasma gondii TaxID=5811 RepID=A0A125YFJ3_TOXGV|nr:WD domain, G-beta repeat-containing protein [Toxoplasma gondii ME49]EPR57579.1 WD domain, G-beta repeat-containing protein [Toxoplasma gondii GT1]ESS29300.1 WD domain, G-beta repeat-containing protein [Toxoplasma gondii VEG]KAF4646145.1 WD domain, G-beta repeat-containing protein [Toxoplasma gondii]KFG35618.1 WD domain, G-beta repeat-containing protein [Toxoplasma gondii p89]KFG59500.1 WD domain, G-beta repeat-containing protein [Toxoplasma gondii RUB]KFH14334.1 WD domain, G-beta repeat-co|eukprot:XP_018638599.1 WD domain, G-beta repeat-containing protein [Toxoplasma gondii ME49]